VPVAQSVLPRHCTQPSDPLHSRRFGHDPSVPQATPGVEDEVNPVEPPLQPQTDRPTTEKTSVCKSDKKEVYFIGPPSVERR
jgi:hypothetical protein